MPGKLVKFDPIDFETMADAWLSFESKVIPHISIGSNQHTVVRMTFYAGARAFFGVSCALVDKTPDTKESEDLLAEQLDNLVKECDAFLNPEQFA